MLNITVNNAPQNHRLRLKSQSSAKAIFITSNTGNPRPKKGRKGRWVGLMYGVQSDMSKQKPKNKWPILAKSRKSDILLFLGILTLVE